MVYSNKLPQSVCMTEGDGGQKLFAQTDNALLHKVLP